MEPRDCERQHALRKIAPMSYGAVLIPRDDMTEDDIRWHFRQMKACGFNSIKQFTESKNGIAAHSMVWHWKRASVANWYGDGGWEGISPGLCEKSVSIQQRLVADIRENPDFLDYQREVFRSRLDYDSILLNPEGQAGVVDEKSAS